MPLIKLLTTGGTIATATDAASGRSSPVLDAQAVAHLVDRDGISAEELSRVPSWSLGPCAIRDIAVRVRLEARACPDGGVVVTFGTSVLEYAAFMTDLFLDSDAPVVFTGAMYSADSAAPDGPQNLRDAVAVASSPDSRGRGALVCFHGRILSARSAWKWHRQDADAFMSFDGDLGGVSAAGLKYFRAPRRGNVFGGSIDPAVALIKSYPGADGSLVAAAAAGGAHGIVIEGLPGAGGVPFSMQDAVRDVVNQGILVALASRAPAGAVPDPPTGGTGSPLMGMRLLSAGDLTSEKAWVLMMVALGEAGDGEGARALFESVARYKA